MVHFPVKYSFIYTLINLRGFFTARANFGYLLGPLRAMHGAPEQAAAYLELNEKAIISPFPKIVKTHSPEHRSV